MVGVHVPEKKTCQITSDTLFLFWFHDFFFRYMRANHHLRCVGLLHQLHNIVPRPHLIEKIIAKDLCNVDTYQRFTLLWHLSRDLELKSSTSPEHRRTFDICLLKMLDTLNMTGGPLKVLSQVQVILFKIDCAFFYTNLHELFCQFISWTNWVKSGEFTDNCWISCQVDDMEKVYDIIIIINLYKSHASYKVKEYEILRIWKSTGLSNLKLKESREFD